MENPIDQEFVELYEESKGIIDKINLLMSGYKKIDDNLKLGFVNEEYLELLNSNEKNCEDLGEKIKRNTQKFVIFGETNSGKSSFINALIFQSNILPVGSRSTTKCFVEIKQSMNNTNYLEVNKKTKKFTELEKSITMKNSRERHVNLFYNFEESDCFANNIIIDTPGTDFDEDYDENILQYCNEADIVILVFNAINNVGKSMKQFCEKFKKDLSKLNLYVVFSHYDILQLRDDWEEGIQENITKLTEIFPNANCAKKAFISSSERMKVIKTDEFVFKDEKSRERNDSFLHLSEQIKNERGQISMFGRYGCLLNILEVMNKNKECLSQMITKQFPFFETDFEDLCGLTSFKYKIKKIVSSYYKFLLEKARERINIINDSEKTPLIDNENLENYDDKNWRESEKEIIEIILGTIENEIKQKVMKEIIKNIERNNGNDKDKLILLMNNIYFHRIMDKIHFGDFEDVSEFIKENKGKIKIAIGAATGAAALGITLATIPAWPVLLPLELAAGAITGIVVGGAVGGAAIGGGVGAATGKFVSFLIEKFGLEKFMKKFGDELFDSFSNFQQQTRKYAELAKRKQKIYEQIEEFKMKMELFNKKYNISPNEESRVNE